MYYHLILVAKFRHKVIGDAISNRLKEIFEYIAPDYNIDVQEWTMIWIMCIFSSRLTLIANLGESSRWRVPALSW